MSDRAIAGINPSRSPEEQGMRNVGGAGGAGLAPSLAAVEAALSRDGNPAAAQALMQAAPPAPGPQPAPQPAPNAPPAPLAPGPEPEGDPNFPDLQQLQQFAAMAEGRAPLPGEMPWAAPAPQAPAIAPSAPEETQAPAAQPEWAAAYQAQQAQTLALQQQLAAVTQLLSQMQQAPAYAPPSSPQDDHLRIAADMRSMGLDPTNEHAVLNYRLWSQQQAREQAWEQRFQQQEQRWQEVYAQARAVTLREDVDQRVAANLKPYANVPEPTRRAVAEMAYFYAQQGHDPSKSVEQALAGIAPLLQRAPKPGPAPAPSALPPQPAPVPAFQGLSQQEVQQRLQAMSAVPVQGRGAGRHGKPPSLDELEALVTRADRLNGRTVRH